MALKIGSDLTEVDISVRNEDNTGWIDIYEGYRFIDVEGVMTPERFYWRDANPFLYTGIFNRTPTDYTSAVFVGITKRAWREGAPDISHPFVAYPMVLGFNVTGYAKGDVTKPYPVNMSTPYRVALTSSKAAIIAYLNSNRDFVFNDPDLIDLIENHTEVEFNLIIAVSDLNNFRDDTYSVTYQPSIGNFLDGTGAEFPDVTRRVKNNLTNRFEMTIQLDKAWAGGYYDPTYDWIDFTKKSGFGVAGGSLEKAFYEKYPYIRKDLEKALTFRMPVGTMINRLTVGAWHVDTDLSLILDGDGIHTTAVPPTANAYIFELSTYGQPIKMTNNGIIAGYGGTGNMFTLGTYPYGTVPGGGGAPFGSVGGSFSGGIISSSIVPPQKGSLFLGGAPGSVNISVPGLGTNRYYGSPGANLGESNANTGPAGNAVAGNAFITWIKLGTIKGVRV